ncbi:hypothetical protein GQ54DRAFT_298077 [Martensiomyces pterosporus]|nr:hypothetical protein GQ54DRAFT_298077 [Martensiomyces pterosporus]
MQKCSIRNSTAAADSDKQQAEGVETRDTRHEEFAKNFIGILKAANEHPKKPLSVDEETQKADRQLAASLAKLFAKSKVDVTPELLERRRKLRMQYPELFKGISDGDLDN